MAVSVGQGRTCTRFDACTKHLARGRGAIPGVSSALPPAFPHRGRLTTGNSITTLALRERESQLMRASTLTPKISRTATRMTALLSSRLLFTFAASPLKFAFVLRVRLSAASDLCSQKSGRGRSKAVRPPPTVRAKNQRRERKRCLPRPLRPRVYNQPAHQPTEHHSKTRKKEREERNGLH